MRKLKSPKKKKATTIIVPVYNGLDFLKACVDSVLKHTQEEYLLILIDDASPDEQIRTYLKSLSDSRVKILFNEKNIGFVATCNKGMRAAGNGDVILLNSDTEVTKGWLEKLHNAAYSDDLIASVSPLSNSAAQASIPVQWEDNEIPEGFTIDSYAKFIEKKSLRLYPQVANTVGFCMYLKKDALDKVGLLDEKSFGRGYGEETDWCMRANRSGYKHVIADDTFVYHKGSASFKYVEDLDEKKKDNVRLIYKRYPELPDLLKKYEEGFVMQKVIRNIEIALRRTVVDEDKKKKILFVNAGDLDQNKFGALIHCKMIIDNLKDNYHFYSMYIKNEDIILQEYVNEEHLGRKYVFNLHLAYDSFEFQNKDIESTFSFILDSFDIEIVHFQSPQDFPLSLIYHAKKKGKTVFFTAHDFLLFCRNFLLITETKQTGYHFCEFEKDPSVCAKCLKRFFPHNNHWTGYVLDRRNFIKEKILPSVDLFITPSQYLKDQLVAIFPNDIKRAKVKVFTHGYDIPSQKVKKLKKVRLPHDEKINIAFFGNFSQTKGSEIFVQIVEKYFEKFNFFLIGRVDDKLSFNKIKKKCFVYGEYKREQGHTILKELQIQLVLILSICNESFSLTTSESWAAGIPVMGIDRGAVGERLRNHKMEDFLIDKLDPVIDLGKKLELLLEDTAALEKSKQRIPTVKSVRENMDEYRGLYMKTTKKVADTDLSEEDDERLLHARVIGAMYKEDIDVHSDTRLTWQNKFYILFNHLRIVHIARPMYRFLKKYISWL